jgi:hypothetical protein
VSKETLHNIKVGLGWRSSVQPQYYYEEEKQEQTTLQEALKAGVVKSTYPLAQSAIVLIC